MLNTYKIIVAALLVIDKINQIIFFEKIFLVANVSPEIVFEMFTFILNSAKVDF